jgi:hypothetical protein
MSSPVARLTKILSRHVAFRRARAVISFCPVGQFLPLFVRSKISRDRQTSSRSACYRQSLPLPFHCNFIPTRRPSKSRQIFSAFHSLRAIPICSPFLFIALQIPIRANPLFSHPYETSRGVGRPRSFLSCRRSSSIVPHANFFPCHRSEDRFKMYKKSACKFFTCLTCKALSASLLLATDAKKGGGGCLPRFLATVGYNAFTPCSTLVVRVARSIAGVSTVVE